VNLCPVEYRGCATPGGWVTPKNLYFGGFRAQKTISSYSFDWTVLIFGYIVERTNTKIIWSHFLQFPSCATWFTAGGAIRIAHYDVVDDVITRKL